VGALARVDLASSMDPAALVGRQVRVLWENLEAWFLGEVTEYMPATSQHKVWSASIPLLCSLVGSALRGAWGFGEERGLCARPGAHARRCVCVCACVFWRHYRESLASMRANSSSAGFLWSAQVGGAKRPCTCQSSVCISIEVSYSKMRPPPFKSKTFHRHVAIQQVWLLCVAHCQDTVHGTLYVVTPKSLPSSWYFVNTKE
jgi:hypothetical protein